MHTKKVISKTSLTNMSRSENRAYFRHVFANLQMRTKRLSPFQHVPEMSDCLGGCEEFPVKR
jgi:hypothetical protein